MKTKKNLKSSEPRGAESRRFQPRGEDVHSTGDEILDYFIEARLTNTAKRDELEAELEDLHKAIVAGITREEAGLRLEEIFALGEHFGGDHVRDLFATATKTLEDAAKNLESMERREAPHYIWTNRDELEASIYSYTDRIALEPRRKSRRLEAYFSKLDAALGRFLSSLEKVLPELKIEIEHFRQDFAKHLNERERIGREIRLLDRELETAPSGKLDTILERRAHATGKDLAEAQLLTESFRRLIEEATRTNITTRLEDVAERLENAAPPNLGPAYQAKLALYQKAIEIKSATADKLDVVFEKLLRTDEARAAFPKVKEPHSLYVKTKEFAKANNLPPIAKASKKSPE